MLPELDTSDWREAFGFAGEPDAHRRPDIRPADPTNAATDLTPFTRADVARIIALSEGQNDGPPWVIAGELVDGRFFSIEAGCDYTGWDCQASGSTCIAMSFGEIVLFGLTDAARDRLGLGV